MGHPATRPSARERKVEGRRGPALLGVRGDHAQQAVDVPGDDRIVGASVELRGVVDGALVAVDDLELDQRGPLPATPPVDRREHSMHLRIRGRHGEGVETGIRGRAHVAGARERSGTRDETVDVASGAGGPDLLRDQAQLVADRARASAPARGRPRARPATRLRAARPAMRRGTHSSGPTRARPDSAPRPASLALTTPPRGSRRAAPSGRGAGSRTGPGSGCAAHP